MKGTVSTESTSLRTALSDMGTLLDEALDYIAEIQSGKPANPIIASAGESIQEVILTGLMNRMLMQPEHGEKESQERPVYEDQSETV